MLSLPRAWVQSLVRERRSHQKVYVGRWARSLLVEEELRAQDVGVMAELEVEAILDGGWVVT